MKSHLGASARLPMRPHLGRLLAVALATIGLLAGMSPVAGAAPATRLTHRFAYISCLADVTDGGQVLFIVAITTETDVYLARYAPGADPDEDPAMAQSDPDLPATVDWQGDVMRSQTPLFDAGGADLGAAAWELRAEPVAVQEFEGRGRNGNQVARERGSEAELAVTGAIALPDGASVTLSPAVCEGYGGENTIFKNNPRAFLDAAEHTLGRCELVTDTGSLVVLLFDDLEVFVGEWGPGADPEEDSPLLSGIEFRPQPGADLAVSVPMFAPGEDDAAFVGDALVAATYTVGRPRTKVFHYPWGRERLQQRALVISGTVALPDGRTIELDGCAGVAELIQVLSIERGRDGGPGSR